MPKVLIVDDSLFMRNHLDKLLGEQGYTTVMAEDGEQAVRLYRSTRPDVVLMDITMPAMSGLDALAQIRLFDPRARVIMLTALDQHLIAARAVHMGALDYLVKPVPPIKLLLSLKKALR
ncbi:MAG: response regulator [Thermoflexales bacterium]|nr:response regulator [Thermoflexales bacterium]